MTLPWLFFFLQWCFYGKRGNKNSMTLSDSVLELYGNYWEFIFNHGTTLVVLKCFMLIFYLSVTAPL